MQKWLNLFRVREFEQTKVQVAFLLQPVGIDRPGWHGGHRTENLTRLIFESGSVENGI